MDFSSHAARPGLLRHSAAALLGALVIFFVTAPAVQSLRDGRFLDGILFTLVMLAAVLAVGGRRRALVVGGVLLLPALVAQWVHHVRGADATYTVYVVTFLVFVLFVVAQLLAFILRSPRVTGEVLCSAVSGYLLLAVLWASAYALVSRLVPGAFSGVPAGSLLQGVDVLYFSVITLTTVGYGDIAPVSGVARMLAMMEAVTGTLYVAVLVARLVSLYSATPAADPPRDAGKL
jgi:voltage-gated potassium channel